MLLLLLPTLALFFFVTTMQRSRHTLWLLRQSSDSILMRATASSFWGGAYRDKTDAYSLELRQWVGTWTIEPGMRHLSIVDGGHGMLCVDQNDDLVVRQGSQDERIGRNPLSRRAPQFVHGGFVFQHREGGLLWYFDFATRSSKPLEIEPLVLNWMTARRPRWRWSVSGLNCLEIRSGNQRRYYRIANGEVVGQIDDSGHPILGVTDNGAWCLVRQRSAPQWAVVDSVSKSVRPLTNREVTWWEVRGNRLIGLYQAKRGFDPINAAQCFDPKSGEPLGEKARFDSSLPWTCEINANGTSLYTLDDMGMLRTVNLDTGVVSHEQIGQGSSWWWPLRLLGIVLAATWWLVWSLGMRREDRSYQPMIDLAILHTVLLACFGVRFYAYMHGPDWVGYLYEWDSVVFLGAAASASGLVMLWVVHGPQSFGFRLGAIAFAVAALAGFAVLVWDVDPLQFDPSMARTKTLVGTSASGATLLALLWFLWAANLRLSHRRDDVVNSNGSEHGFSIRHMIGWTVAFALLFVMLRARTFQLPDRDSLWQLLASGSASGLATGALIWGGLGKAKIRYLLVPVGLGVAGLVYWKMERHDVIRVGAAMVPLILISMLTLRWNGYALRRPIVALPEEDDS